MKRKHYDETVKAAILVAAQDARNSGKSWAEAFEASKNVGYKGTVKGLVQFVAVRNAPKKTEATEPNTSAPASAPVKKTRRKRRAKSAVAPTVKAPAASASTSGSLDITALVHKTVTDAVVSALEGLLANLKGGK